MVAYFFLLLSHGVRFDKNEYYLLLWWSQLTDWLDATPSLDTGGTFTEGGAEAGPLGMIVGFLLDVLISIVLTLLLAVVLWLSMNVFVTAVVLLGAPLFFLFRRSVRYVVAKGRSYHQDSRRARWFALRATWRWVGDRRNTRRNETVQSSRLPAGPLLRWTLAVCPSAMM